MRGLAITIAMVLLLGTAAWYTLHFIPADFIYGVETEFDAVPANDANYNQEDRSCGQQN